MESSTIKLISLLVVVGLGLVATSYTGPYPLLFMKMVSDPLCMFIYFLSTFAVSQISIASGCVMVLFFVFVQVKIALILQKSVSVK